MMKFVAPSQMIYALKLKKKSKQLQLYIDVKARVSLQRMHLSSVNIKHANDFFLKPR